MTLADPTRCQYVGTDIGDDDTAARCENTPSHWVRRKTRQRGDHVLCFCGEHIDGFRDSETTIEIRELPLPEELRD